MVQRRLYASMSQCQPCTETCCLFPFPSTFFLLCLCPLLHEICVWAGRGGLEEEVWPVLCCLLWNETMASLLNRVKYPISRVGFAEVQPPGPPFMISGNIGQVIPLPEPCCHHFWHGKSGGLHLVVLLRGFNQITGRWGSALCPCAIIVFQKSNTYIQPHLVHQSGPVCRALGTVPATSVTKEPFHPSIKCV